VRKFQFEKPLSGGKLRIAYPFRFEPRPAKQVARPARAP